MGSSLLGDGVADDLCDGGAPCVPVEFAAGALERCGAHGLIAVGCVDERFDGVGPGVGAELWVDDAPGFVVADDEWESAGAGDDRGAGEVGGLDGGDAEGFAERGQELEVGIAEQALVCIAIVWIGEAESSDGVGGFAGVAAFGARAHDVECGVDAA